VVLALLGEEEEGGKNEMTTESTPTRVIFARVPVNLQTRVKHRAAKYGMSINDVAKVALERWCEFEEAVEMSVSKLANELDERIRNAPNLPQ
jgi:hypothetical protein